MASLYVFRTTPDAFTHDYGGHVEYTRYIYQHHAFPAPRQGWEMFHPPLYYLVNLFLEPVSRHHTLYVRLASVVYGAIFLVLIIVLLEAFATPAPVQVLILLALMSTPAFLFTFSTYNNDSLAAMLSGFVCVISWRLQMRWNMTEAVGLMVITLAGLYTKYSLVFVVMAMLGISIWGSYKKVWAWKQTQRMIIVFTVALLGLMPWLISHNYYYTKRLWPHNSDNGNNQLLILPKSPFVTILTPPGFSDGEWADPYTHQWEKSGTKKSSFWAYQLASSIFGEFTFTWYPGFLVWLMLWIHLFLYMEGLFARPPSPMNGIAKGTIALAFLSAAYFVFRCPEGPAMDFRYIAWTWVPWSLLWASSFTPQRRSWQLMTIFLWGLLIAIQFGLWICLIEHWGQGNGPRYLVSPFIIIPQIFMTLIITLTFCRKQAVRDENRPAMAIREKR